MSTKVPMTKLRRSLEGKSDIWDVKAKDLRFWTLVIAGCAAETEDDGIWVIETLRRDVFHWTELERVKDMWWIDEIFGPSNIGMALDLFKIIEL